MSTEATPEANRRAALGATIVDTGAEASPERRIALDSEFGTEGSGRLHASIFARSPALEGIAEAIRAGTGVVTIGRADGAGAALLLGFVAARLRRPLLAITASPDEADRVRRNWSTFLDTPAEDFPPWESVFDGESEPEPEIFAQRQGIAEGFAAGKVLSAVAPIQAILQPISRTRERSDRTILLRRGDHLPPANLARMLVDAGYRRFPQVARPGDFSIRGGIFDIYPREGVHPYRIDFLGDEIDSIRAVSLADHRSQAEVPLVALTLLKKSEYFLRGFTGSEVTLFERLPKSVLVALLSPRDVEERCTLLIGQWAPRRAEEIASQFWAQGAHLTRLEMEPFVPEPGRRPITLPVLGTEQFQGPLDRVCTHLRDEEARGGRIEVFFRQLAEVERFREILGEARVGPGCRTLVGDLSAGCRWEEERPAIFLSGGAILGRVQALAPKRARRTAPTRAGD